MFEALDDLRKYSSLMVIVICMIFIAMSGVMFAVTYYTMDVIQDGFEDTDCVIENNSLVSSCQELWSISLYPFLNLKDLLIWFSYFFIFSLVLAMLLTGYNSGKSPVLMGLLTIFLMVVVYMSIEISNMYRTMLTNDLLRSMMTSFTVYNKIMLNFPYFMFFVGLFSIVLGFVNYQKTNINTPTNELNY